MIIPQNQIQYPDGIAVKSEAGVFYLKGNIRYELPTERIINSWGFAFIPMTTEFALSGYKRAGKLGFRDATLVKSMSDRSLYIVSGGRLRKITNPDWLMRLQLDERDFVKVSSKELFQKEGEELD